VNRNDSHSSRLCHTYVSPLYVPLSKKWQDQELMFALFVAWYNFCRDYVTLKTTPAAAAG